MIDRELDAADNVLRKEGGHVSHAADPGGATNWGMSLRFLLSEKPEFFAGITLDQDKDGDIDAEDVRAMPREAAVEILRRWWRRYGYARLAVGVGEKTFDMSVNMGPGQAHRLLQRAINDCSGSVVVDGVLGPRTVAAANAINPQRLLSQICTRQADFYQALVKQNPQLRVFLRGWLNRAAA
jgi:lysozyme family protein